MTPIDSPPPRVSRSSRSFCRHARPAQPPSSPAPACRSPPLRQQRRRNAVVVVGEVERIAALVAQEIAVHAGLVAVVAAHNLRSIRWSSARPASSCSRRRSACTRWPRGSSPTAASCSDRSRWSAHPPGRRRCTCRTARNPHAPADPGSRPAGRVRRDHRRGAAVLNAQREHIHAFAAHAYTAVAQDAARPVEVHHRRPLLLLAMVLRLGIKALRRAVLEGHVLQLALAAGIAHRAIQRMVAEQQLQASPCAPAQSPASRSKPPCLRQPASCTRSAASASFSMRTTHMRHAACRLSPG